MRELFWKDETRFPEGVWRAVVAISIVAGITAAWVALLGRTDFSLNFVGYASAAVVFYVITTALRESDLRRASASGDWSEAAVVGLSARHGILLVGYGVGGFALVFIFNLLPNLFLGAPNYAYTAHGAFSLLIAAPWVEEILVMSAWGLVYTLTPASSPVRWLVATAVVTGGWLYLHGGTYAGAGSFAWVSLGISRVLYCFLDWLPTARGHPPSAIPSLIAHTLNNAYAFWALCVAAVAPALTPFARICF